MTHKTHHTSSWGCLSGPLFPLGLCPGCSALFTIVYTKICSARSMGDWRLWRYNANDVASKDEGFDDRDDHGHHSNAVKR